jgi:FkbM family methyltransferase
MNFLADFLKVISKNISNDHKDNWDYYRYGPEAKMPLKQKALGTFLNYLNRKGYFHLDSFVKANLENSSKFEYLYKILETAEDRELLLTVLAYRILGYKKVKLPLNTPSYWTTLLDMEKRVEEAEKIRIPFNKSALNKFDIFYLGYPIKFYYTALGVMIDFVIKQYEYNNNNKVIKAEPGDAVIDAGGCWGDTALYFANEVGDSGRVYSFEFIPNNINLFERNVSMNPSHKERIELVTHPVWNDSTTKIYFKDAGPGSNVSLEPFEGRDGECMTLSIDDLVSQRGIKKVDFIKMDIEGAEANALKGAGVTIKKYKPKLAIALYHSFEDFERIPKLIREMVPEYRFFFSHCTIYGEESMLFATID